MATVPHADACLRLQKLSSEPSMQSVHAQQQDGTRQASIACQSCSKGRHAGGNPQLVDPCVELWQDLSPAVHGGKLGRQVHAVCPHEAEALELRLLPQLGACGVGQLLPSGK